MMGYEHGREIPGGTKTLKIIEAEDGKSYRAELIENSADKWIERIEGSHQLLADTFSASEVDSLDTIKTAIEGKVVGDKTSPDTRLLVTVIENDKGEVIGTTHSAVLEVLNDDFEPKSNKATMIDCYTVIQEGERGRGIGFQAYQHRIEMARIEAESRGLKLDSAIAEVDAKRESFYNQAGLKRLYFQTEDGNWQEVPYFQSVLADAWDKKTGNPRPGQEKVAEHLMIAQLDGRTEITVEELLEKIRAVMNYNSYQTRGYFENKKAFDTHEKILAQDLAELEGSLSRAKGGVIKLMTAAERGRFKKDGRAFSEHQTADKK